ncbi:TIR domain-containing protein [Agrobacterium deltaense]|uniref:TIR domain-containing protein n=1 Tax=Agrobacterium deltaense TaxID=1183412 RepID=UPI003FD6A809
MAYRNKTYICFDGDNDMKYYRLMTAWAENEKFSFDFHNAHDLNTARDSSQEESIKRQLRERLANSKLLVVLIGNNTRYLSKFVKWEMEVALRLGLPIVCVNLNGSRSKDDLCPPVIRDELAVYVPFGAKIVEYAMTNWPSSHAAYKKEGKTGAFHYTDQTYRNLGL